MFAPARGDRIVCCRSRAEDQRTAVTTIYVYISRSRRRPRTNVSTAPLRRTDCRSSHENVVPANKSSSASAEESSTVFGVNGGGGVTKPFALAAGRNKIRDRRVPVMSPCRDGLNDCFYDAGRGRAPGRDPEPVGTLGAVYSKVVCARTNVFADCRVIHGVFTDNTRRPLYGDERIKWRLSDDAKNDGCPVTGGGTRDIRRDSTAIVCDFVSLSLSLSLSYRVRQ